METKDRYAMNNFIVQALDLKKSVVDGHQLWYILFKQSVYDEDNKHSYRRALACFRIRVNLDETNDQALERLSLGRIRTFQGCYIHFFWDCYMYILS